MQFHMVGVQGLLQGLSSFRCSSTAALIFPALSNSGLVVSHQVPMLLNVQFPEQMIWAESLLKARGAKFYCISREMFDNKISNQFCTTCQRYQGTSGSYFESHPISQAQHPAVPGSSPDPAAILARFHRAKGAGLSPVRLLLESWNGSGWLLHTRAWR